MPPDCLLPPPPITPWAAHLRRLMEACDRKSKSKTRGRGRTKETP